MVVGGRRIMSIGTNIGQTKLQCNIPGRPLGRARIAGRRPFRFTLWHFCERKTPPYHQDKENVIECIGAIAIISAASTCQFRAPRGHDPPTRGRVYCHDLILSRHPHPPDVANPEHLWRVANDAHYYPRHDDAWPRVPAQRLGGTAMRNHVDVRRRSSDALFAPCAAGIA